MPIADDMGTIIYSSYALAHLILLGWACWLWRSRHAPAQNIA